jgi:hypothetical protein
VKVKGSSRRRKEEMEKKNKNEKWGGIFCVDLFYFSLFHLDDYAVGLIQLNYITGTGILIQY